MDRRYRIIAPVRASQASGSYRSVSFTASGAHGSYRVVRPANATGSEGSAGGNRGFADKRDEARSRCSLDHDACWPVIFLDRPTGPTRARLVICFCSGIFLGAHATGAGYLFFRLATVPRDRWGNAHWHKIFGNYITRLSLAVEPKEKKREKDVNGLDFLSQPPSPNPNSPSSLRCSYLPPSVE
jgi:hypothetical protein